MKCISICWGVRSLYFVGLVLFLYCCMCRLWASETDLTTPHVYFLFHCFSHTPTEKDTLSESLILLLSNSPYSLVNTPTIMLLVQIILLRWYYWIITYTFSLLKYSLLFNLSVFFYWVKSLLMSHFYFEYVKFTNLPLLHWANCQMRYIGRIAGSTCYILIMSTIHRSSLFFILRWMYKRDLICIV